jgi:hypothetical protein
VPVEGNLSGVLEGNQLTFTVGWTGDFEGVYIINAATAKKLNGYGYRAYAPTDYATFTGARSWQSSTSVTPRDGDLPGAYRSLAAARADVATVRHGDLDIGIWPRLELVSGPRAPTRAQAEQVTRGARL